MGKEEAKKKVEELVKKYKALSPAEIKRFKEEMTKQGFIEPLFKALGWDFENINEVTPEEKASSGRVDYAFKLNTVSQFYVEAKPLKADLTNETYIKQAVTYAYNKGVTWAILTDFETLTVYAAQTSKPFITLTCNKYIDAFDDLWLLSKESFQNNALGEKAERYGALPQRMGIEQRLFNQLKAWREELSTQLHSYEKKLSVKQIDEVIQRLFNRLIFIRTCEDRKIEEKILLSTVHEWIGNKRKGELIEKLREIFRYFDGYYDSELFQKHMTDEIFIEGETLANLINGLYEVPGGIASYDFSIIDADVLGAVYEQYLGHIANIVKQRAKDAQARMDLGLPYDETIELTAKKQHRKEQGIYYTPKFITDYIVKETVGRFLAEHSAKEIRNIKILDPACGSGSFLIRAFDELLKYYASQKISKSEQDIDAADRMAILQSNIYGVDLDIQAVEIARLNLLLRSLAKRETLPGLKDNIKEGNSLISGTEEELKKYFGDGWKDKKAFNWEEEFKEIMANGGFDVVIGNPPYGADLNNKEKDYLKDKYKYVSDFETAQYFIGVASKLLKADGYLAFIVPNTIFYNVNAKKFRHFIANTFNIKSLLDLSGLDVFSEAKIRTWIPILLKSKTINDNVSFYKLTGDKTNNQLYNVISQKELLLNDKLWAMLSISGNDTLLLKKIKTKTIPLSDILEVSQGLIPYDKYRGHDEYTIKNRIWHSKNKKDKTYKRELRGGDIKRYSITWNGKQWISYGPWLAAPRKAEFFTKPRLLFREITDPNGQYLNVAYSEEEYYNNPSVINCIGTGKEYSLKYCLGISNSKLIAWYHHNSSPKVKKGIFPKILVDDVRNLPIKIIDFNKPQEKKAHDTLISLVEKMLELNKQYAPIRNTPFSESEELKKEIEKTDKEIDNLVYDLYGLTEAERKIVEGEV